jgi:hypothetical protein
MTRVRPTRLLTNAFSPYGLAGGSYAFFLLMCLIPPSTYRHYMNEPDMMFLDPATILYYSFCVAAFIAGVWLVDWLFPTPFADCELKARFSPTKFLLAPLAVGVAAATFSIYLLLKQAPQILLLLFSRQGGNLKETLAFEVEGGFTAAPLLLTAICWWAFHRSSSFPMRGWRRWLIRCALVMAVLSVIAASLLTLSRNLLMPLVCGMTILYLRDRLANRRAGRRFILKSGAAIAVSIVLMFFAFSVFRGATSWDAQIHSLLGYTAASYNRLAAIVNGQLHYPFGGFGVYLSSVATHTRLLPFRNIVNPPDDLAIWASEFSAVSQAGLDGTFIWSGAFGYIFSDLGWYSPAFLFCYGVIYGFVWNWFKAGRIAGVVLYPWMGFCIVFWIGTNYLLDSPAEIMLAAAVLLAIYERFSLKRQLRLSNVDSLSSLKGRPAVPSQSLTRGTS